MGDNATWVARPGPAPQAAAAGSGWRRLVVGSVLVYLAMRLVSAVVILLGQRAQPALPGLSSRPYLGMIMHWDALWFRAIALTGYPHHLPHHLDGRIIQNQWAFFAGFPFVTRGVMAVTGLHFVVAASLVNLVAGAAAACAIARLLELRTSRRVALGVVAVWAALPMAPTLQLPYSEALAMAFLSWALLWLVQGHWGRAAVAGVLLGLTRPILPALAAVYALTVWRRWRRRVEVPISPSERWRMLVGLAATAAGCAMWPVIAWWWTGVPGAYTRTEAAWHHGDVAPFSGSTALATHVLEGHLRWVRIAVICVSVLAIVLTALALRAPRLDPVLAWWCVAYLVYDLAVDNMHAAELRMVLPLFPLVAVACGAVSRRLGPWWRQRVWAGVSLGILGQYAWVMLFLRIVPGARHAP